MTDKHYWHELTEQEQVLIRASTMPFTDFLEQYQQPEWCEYPDALAGPMGCWALFYGRVHDKEYCKNCDCLREAK